MSSDYETNPTSTGSKDFTWTIKNPCVDPTYAYVIQGSDPNATQDSAILDALFYIIYDESLTYDEQTEHTLYTTTSNTLCGGLTYSAKYDGSAIDALLNQSAGDLVSFDAVSDANKRTFVIDSDDESLIESFKIYSMRVELTNYPTATYATASFKEYTSTITFQDPRLVGDVCENPVVASITPTSQTASVTDDYSGTAKTWTYNPFTIFPGLCASKITVSCTSIDGPNLPNGSTHPLQCTDYEVASDNTVSLTFTSAQYENLVVAPGTYTFNYQVTTDSSVPELTKPLSFDLILTDVCDPPTTFELSSTNADISYTITDTKKTVPTDIFNIVPSYCKF